MKAPQTPVIPNTRRAAPDSMMGKPKATQNKTVPETAPENLPNTRALAKTTGTQSDQSISDKLDQVLATIELSRVSMED